ncbi:MAG: hypothetical protein ACREAC_20485, partial [Blastocatellia bacterium]
MIGKSLSLLAAMSVVVVLGSAERSTAADRGAFKVEPPAQWVRPDPLPSAPPVAGNAASSGIIYVLDDHQVRVNDRSSERYYHQIYVVATAAGLD